MSMSESGQPAQREGLIHMRISALEEGQDEIQARVSALMDRLGHVLSSPAPNACDKSATVSPTLPPMGERLNKIVSNQQRTISFLSDILQRLEI